MPPFINGNDILWENIKEIFNYMKRYPENTEEKTKKKKAPCT